jgi:hypothetical protein
MMILAECISRKKLVSASFFAKQVIIGIIHPFRNLMVNPMDGLQYLLSRSSVPRQVSLTTCCLNCEVLPKKLQKRGCRPSGNLSNQVSREIKDKALKEQCLTKVLLLT